MSKLVMMHVNEKMQRIMRDPRGSDYGQHRDTAATEERRGYYSGGIGVREVRVGAGEGMKTPDVQVDAQRQIRCLT